MNYHLDRNTNITIEGVAAGVGLTILLGLIFLPKVFHHSGVWLQDKNRKR